MGAAELTLRVDECNTTLRRGPLQYRLLKKKKKKKKIYGSMSAAYFVEFRAKRKLGR